MSATSRMSLMEATQSAVVDLQESQAFNEPFYVVVVEKENDSDPHGHDDSFGLMDSRPPNSRRLYHRNTGIVQQAINKALPYSVYYS